MSIGAVEHRLATGRLHVLRRGVYAVGRPELGEEGSWMAAVLACGHGAVLSHRSAAALWGIAAARGRTVDISVPFAMRGHPPEVRMHRRYGWRRGDRAAHRGIPVTSPVRTLLDLAVDMTPEQIERAVSDADRLDLVDPEQLHDAIGAYRGERGVARLRAVLERRTFRLTDSELERRFLRLIETAGLPTPRTGVRLNGFKVDFFWPDLALVVETDGLRYHRTPIQQTRDRLRDQAHTAAGMTALRFTHEQVRFEPRYVSETLRTVIARLEAGSRAGSRESVQGTDRPAPGR